MVYLSDSERLLAIHSRSDLKYTYDSAARGFCFHFTAGFKTMRFLNPGVFFEMLVATTVLVADS